MSSIRPPAERYAANHQPGEMLEEVEALAFVIARLEARLKTETLTERQRAAIGEAIDVLQSMRDRLRDELQ